MGTHRSNASVGYPPSSKLITPGSRSFGHLADITDMTVFGGSDNIESRSFYSPTHLSSSLHI